MTPSLPNACRKLAKLPKVTDPSDGATHKSWTASASSGLGLSPHPSRLMLLHRQWSDNPSLAPWLLGLGKGLGAGDAQETNTWH